MLLDLIVENYAVIEHVRVRFHQGLNLLTGETGSGKSIVVDALGLLFGARSSADMVRTGAERARISGIFEVAQTPALMAFCEAAGIAFDNQNELIVDREIQANGKSRAFIGGRPVNATLLKELAPYLGDIHGQHDQQELFSAAVQLEMLDAFAEAEDVAPLYDKWHAISAELTALDASAQEKLRMADMWSFQKKEIEAVSPKPGEDAQLESERRVLRNVVQLEETAGAAYNTLYDAPESVAVQLRIVLRRLEELMRIDEAVGEVVGTLQPAAIAVDEAAHALRGYLGKLEADPGKLDELESRLAAIEKLKRKYGQSVDEILTFLEEARTQLASVENSSERRAALKKEIDAAAAAYQAAAEKLSAKRKAAALKLAKRVETELASLAMEKTRVKIAVEPAEWSRHGMDSVAILISANPGEEPKPLEKIASGGELSRVALALKTCTAPPVTNAAPRTLVFDEVDAGVGGSAAEAVGRRLKKLSASSQLLCVTHLPQIAAFADHHYFVEKHQTRGRTHASIQQLSATERTQEIGRMLSGERVTPEALRHAAQLIKSK